MSCSNCFNGCVNIQSDQCVKYTGPDVEFLDIDAGDSLQRVEEAIVDYLLSIRYGDGIFFTFDEGELCTIVSGYLNNLEEITLSDIITAIVKSICSIAEDVTALSEDIAELNAAYTTDCLSGSPEGIRDVVQAIIDKLCIVSDDLVDLETSVPNTYVSVADLPDLIAAYLSNTTSTLMCNKMVPWAITEYYGPLSYFDASGAGTGNWVDIYLCNGDNGTPDLRGRIPVGVTNMYGSVSRHANVEPGGFTPNYTKNVPAGANSATLTTDQIPAHQHLAYTTITTTPHTHYAAAVGGTSLSLSSTTQIKSSYDPGDNDNYVLRGTDAMALSGLTSSTTVYATAETGISMVGGGQAHSNIQPVLPVYFIIYIPSS
jgi:microcystin-dependent protein